MQRGASGSRDYESNGAVATVEPILRHDCSRAQSTRRTPQRREAIAKACGVASRICCREEERPSGTRRERVFDSAAGSTSAVRDLGSRERTHRGRRSQLAGPGCCSPRRASSPSSGQWAGDGCADSRGVPALPTSPSAGLRPIPATAIRAVAGSDVDAGQIEESLDQERTDSLTSTAGNVQAGHGVDEPATRPRTHVGLATESTHDDA